MVAKSTPKAGSSGAPKGNVNGTKLKDPDIRQVAYQQYCEWVARGKSMKSFCFEHEQLTCTYRTLDKYIEDDPIEFPPIKMEMAKCKGYNRWEQVVEDSAEGKNKDANTASLQMLMRNKFSWDKEEKGSDNKPSDPIKVVIADTKDLDANDRVFAQPSQITPGSDSST